MEDNQPFVYLLTAISQVGFPIVLAVYLLVRFEKKLESLSDRVAELREPPINANENEERRGSGL
ncbi:YvrJ family protein [Cohnella lubricantis]|uniref:YvrJ family protein n=1 Tax=Cohnella lubricantis TaxID=2163172 RepID=A0A841TCB2_9BACL|nr:YvrJ family protein [Cohnella lubricantis]MBB6678652.1 YvrJ family protein [Cohnella lubricantis]MBP2119188.1 hypothetical protein [Cohnella lubricantis]